MSPKDFTQDPNVISGGRAGDIAKRQPAAPDPRKGRQAAPPAPPAQAPAPEAPQQQPSRQGPARLRPSQAMAPLTVQPGIRGVVPGRVIDEPARLRPEQMQTVKTARDFVDTETPAVARENAVARIRAVEQMAQQQRAGVPAPTPAPAPALAPAMEDDGPPVFDWRDFYKEVNEPIYPHMRVTQPALYRRAMDPEGEARRLAEIAQTEANKAWSEAKAREMAMPAEVPDIPQRDRELADKMDDVVIPQTNPKSSHPPLSDRKLPAAKAADSKDARMEVKNDRPGSAVGGVMTGDNRVGLEEIWVPVEKMYRALQDPRSRLYDIFSQDKSIDMEQMKYQAYAEAAIAKFFNKKGRNFVGYVEKFGPDEASGNNRVIRVHRGDTILIHPLSAHTFTADFDGDEIVVSVNFDAKNGARGAMDFLTSMDREVKFPPEQVDFAIWHHTVEGTQRVLSKMFVRKNSDGISLTEQEVALIARDLHALWAGDDASESMYSMLHSIRKMTMRFADPNHAAARVIWRIFKKNADIRGASRDYWEGWDTAQIPRAVDRPSPIDPTRPELTSEAWVGGNQGDMMTMHNAPLVTPPGKNFFLRWLSIGKRVKRWARGGVETRESSTTPVSAEDIHAAAKSGKQLLDTTTDKITGKARQEIYFQLGMPDVRSPEAFAAWIVEFCEVFNDVASTYNLPAARFNLEMKLQPYDDLLISEIPMEKDPKSTDLRRRAIRKEFRAIYGGFTMEELFGVYAPRGYRQMTLEEFIQTNNLVDMGMKNTSISTVENFILRLADIRNSFPREFDTKLRSALESLMVDTPTGQITKLRDVAARRGTAAAYTFEAEIDALITAFYAFDPDTHRFLGLTSPKAFIESPLGRVYAFSTSTEEIGRAYYEAIVRTRMDVIWKLEKFIKETKSEKKRTAAEGRLTRELAALASSSDVWRVIVKSYTTKADPMTVFNKVFFSGLMMSEINDQLAAAVRNDPMGRPAIKPYDIAYELLARPKGPHSTDRFSEDQHHSTMRKHVQASKRSADGYARGGYDFCIKQVKVARKKFMGPPDTMYPGARSIIEGFLAKVAADTRVLVEFNPMFMVEAQQSLLERTFKSGEKAEQEVEMNYAVGIVNFLINGDIHSDLAIALDFELGAVAADRFQKIPIILAKLLSDPAYSITVYAADGSDMLLSRAVLFKNAADPNNPTEWEIWDWLEAHPRAAMSLRMHSMSNSVDTETGFTSMAATQFLSETIEIVASLDSTEYAVENKVLRELADKPGLYALAMLATKIDGQRRFQLHDGGVETYYKLVHLLRSLAGRQIDMLDFVRDTMKETPGFTYNMAEIDHVYEMGNAITTPLTDALSEDIRFTKEYMIGKIMHEVARNLESYVSIVTDMDLPAEHDLSAANVATIFHFENEGSLRAYEDTLQAFSSAKVQTHTAVTGAESIRNADLMVVGSYVNPEPCASPGPVGIAWDDFDSNLLQYMDMNVHLKAEDRWVAVNDENYDEIFFAVMASEDQLVYVEDPAYCASPVCPCKRHATSDPSTDYGSPQTPALGRLLTIMRSLSAEKLNLQYKTKGIDLLDSIVKSKIFEFSGQGVYLTLELDRLYNEASDPAVGLAAARVRLAEAIRDNMRRRGYTNELSRMDLVNIAHIMLLQIQTEGGVQLKILSLGHLNSIAKNAADAADSKYEGGATKNQSRDAMLAGIAAAAVPGEFDLEGLFSGMKVHQYDNMGPRTTYQRGSVAPRNLALQKLIVAQNPDVKIHTQAQLESEERTLMSLDSAAYLRWRDYAGTPDQDPNNPFENSDKGFYRILGILSSKGWRGEDALGPKAAWIIDVTAKGAANYVARAHQYGLTVLLEGWEGMNTAQKEKFWQKVDAQTGGIDANQQKVIDSNRSMLPMFDLRLNGRNTSVDTQVMGAGEWHARREGVRWVIESPVNEFGLGDGEMVAYRSCAESLRGEKTGTLETKASVMFANLIKDADSTRHGGIQLTHQSPYLAKDQAKADLATKYIGRGSPTSATQEYAENFGVRANVGYARKNAYSRDDVVFVGAEGRRNARLDPDFDEIQRALDAHATIVTDDPANRERNWNIGERQIAEYLIEHGYVEPKSDGIWREPDGEGGWLSGPLYGSRDNWVATIATKAEIETILDGTARFTIDTGVAYTEGSTEDRRLRDDMDRFEARRDELTGNDRGTRGCWLTTALPGEIIGWVRLQAGEVVVYHPIRPYETGRQGGAPASLQIQNVVFDTAGGALVVDWEHSGSMLNRAHKVMLDFFESQKMMARPDVVEDIEFANGTKPSWLVDQKSTESRWGYMRPHFKMATVWYMVRVAYGYNLAGHENTFPADEELKERLFTGTARVEDWVERLPFDDLEASIQFFPEDMVELNKFANVMARRALRYGINPTNVFGSRFEKEFGQPALDSDVWFNFHILMGDGPYFQACFMNFIDFMIKGVVPAQDLSHGDYLTFVDTGKTLFNKDLQLAVPYTYINEQGKTVKSFYWANVYGGFHSLDEHWVGYSGAGATTNQSDSIPSRNARIPSSFDRMTEKQYRLYRRWAGAAKETYNQFDLADLGEDAPDVEPAEESE